MKLNFLETLGVLMIFFFISIIVIIISCIIKDAVCAIKDIVDVRKKARQKKCPFCGVYLRGYQYEYRGVKFDARFCSRCGKPLDGEEKAFDQVQFAKACKSTLLSSNTKRAWCKACMLYGKDCDGVSGNCDCAIIKEKKNDHD